MLKEMRRNKLNEKARVIILTNVADPAKAAEAKKYGVEDFWVKTVWDFEKLFIRVEEKLKKAAPDKNA